MADLPTARAIRLAGLWTGAHATVILDHDGRFVRRKRLQTTAGDGFLVDLEHTANLAHGDALVLDDGRLIAIEAAEEPLLEVRGPDLARLAWHIGNRHTPCQIEPLRLLIRRDPVLEDMLQRLGAEVRQVVVAFRPEGGAYGLGRTMGHSHSHSHDLSPSMAESANSFAVGPAEPKPRGGTDSPHRHVHFHVSHHAGTDDSAAESE